MKRMKAADKRVSTAPKTSNTPPLLLPPSADNRGNKVDDEMKEVSEAADEVTTLNC